MTAVSEPRRLATVQAEDAHRVATRDRESTADMILAVAVDQATARLRRGLPVEYVAARLQQAATRAARLYTIPSTISSSKGR